MRIREADIPFKLPGSDSPLKKSTSVTAIIHGGSNAPNNSYYVDSLQRFRRDHASVDRHERDQQKQKLEDAMTRKRQVKIERELSLKQLEEANVAKLQERQNHSLYLHRMGSKMSVHSHGVPLDPVSQRYQETERGRGQAMRDDQKRVEGLVRAHHLQTCGTSGYNIINGQSSLSVEQMVGSSNLPMFQQKLSQYYEKFRIKPTDLPS